MNKTPQQDAFEAFVRSGASSVSPSEVDNPLADGTYRTSGANAAWAMWQAAQAAMPQRHPVSDDEGLMNDLREYLHSSVRLKAYSFGSPAFEQERFHMLLKADALAHNVARSLGATKGIFE
jgi:hypothetical protein